MIGFSGTGLSTANYETKKGITIREAGGCFTLHEPHSHVMRPLPDSDLSLRDASDFIFESELCRKALLAPQPASLGVFLRDLISSIHRLTVSCHLPEFTDHGLLHLCSLVDRISGWTSPARGERPKSVVEGLEASECAVLLLATLFHDIGMLSQRPEDLPQTQPQWNSKGFRDVPNWVRSTHIERMEALTRRLFEANSFSTLFDHPVLMRSFNVARAHGTWPWQWSPRNFQLRDAGLAAMLAVADLLDEDSNRCDTATLLGHRLGNHLNSSHWIRHGLTHGRVLVEAGVIRVELRRPPNSDAQLAPVYSALRNHYRLALLYLRELGQVNAGILNLVVFPENGCPDEQAENLDGWERLQGFATQSALVFQLLNSFMPEALLDTRRVDPETIERLRALGLEKVDLQHFYVIRGDLELHSYEEQAFLALLGNKPASSRS